MFTHLLPKNGKILSVTFTSYSERHFLKRFQKDYGKKQWQMTLASIQQDISRIKMPDSDLQQTQQVDELWHDGDYWIFKYDFRVAQTKESAKTSGNRCVCFLNLKAETVKVLLIFSKGDLPKNTGEQVFIEQSIKENFPEYYNLARGTDNYKTNS